MLDFRKNEVIIVENLKNYLTSDQRPCEVVRQNQVSKIPPYPYVSYSVITPAHQFGGTYSETEDGIFYRTIQQTWSFTTQSDDQEEALELAYKILDFFTAIGLQTLSDNDIVVLRTGAINTRDNLITMQYEYRNGLDITFGLSYSISPNELDEIKTYEFKFKEE